MVEFNKDDFKEDDETTWFRPWRWKSIGLTTKDEDELATQDYQNCSYSN